MECEVEEVRCMRSGIHGETLSDYMIKSYDKRTGLTDVTIHCNESIYHAHRIVLSHYSGFFKNVFESLVGVVNHFDVFLEGFSPREVEVSLLFMYTGGVLCYNGENPNSFNSVAHALHIPLLNDFLYAQQYAQCEENDKLITSPVAVWEKCENSQIDIIDNANSTSSRDDSNHADKHDTASGSVRRKQARPQRHTASPSPGGSPEALIVEEEEEISIDGCSDEEELECHESVRSVSPDVSQENKSIIPVGVMATPPPPPAPPNFMFLRNMINNPGGFYPPGNFCAPQHIPQIQQKKIKDKVLWGKILKHQAFHATSRAQHSAPRGGPPRAWSNQDLTEALHNVWNKKMTTSQASRIFGIPYNSLLMYVRGKYGKSLKLDLLKKGLDLALLEKQKQAAMEQARKPVFHKDHSDQRICNAVPPPQQNNNVVEWMMMNNSTITSQNKPDNNTFIRNPHQQQ